MPGWLTIFILFVAVCALASLGARRMAIVGGRVRSLADKRPEGGRTKGDLDAYFAMISDFDVSVYDCFFVSAMHIESQKFVQVSAARRDDGKRVWQFDIPLNDLHAPFENKISFEAKSRGQDAEVTSQPGMRFLDIDFSDRSAHDAFARWVVTQVFDVPETDAFEISWG